MTDGVLLRETLKDSDLDKYRYAFYNPDYEVCRILRFSFKSFAFIV